MQGLWRKRDTMFNCFFRLKVTSEISSFCLNIQIQYYRRVPLVGSDTFRQQLGDAGYISFPIW